jgi:DNA-binding protein H-NS
MALLPAQKYSLEDLLDLQHRIAGAISVASRREALVAKAEVDAVLDRHGMSFADLAGLYGVKLGHGTRMGAPVAVKFRNPANALETWTGRGRQPRWMTGLLAAGAKLDDFRV